MRFACTLVMLPNHIAHRHAAHLNDLCKEIRHAQGDIMVVPSWWHERGCCNVNYAFSYAEAGNGLLQMLQHASQPEHLALRGDPARLRTAADQQPVAC